MQNTKGKPVIECLNSFKTTQTCTILNFYFITNIMNLYPYSCAYNSSTRQKRSIDKLLYKGYTYSWRNNNKNGTYRTGSSHHQKGCKANIITDESKSPFVMNYMNTKQSFAS